MGATDQRAALGSSTALVSMNLDDRLPLIKAPTLIVTTQESGRQTVEEAQQIRAPLPSTKPRPLIVPTQESALQPVEAVQQFAARIPGARVIVLDGDSYHIAA